MITSQHKNKEKKIAIVQSNYIPWKGYFDIINSVDEFIIGDELQYTRCDWRNRNIIKTFNGLRWLTIPIKTKQKCFQKIIEAKVVEKRWPRKHWLMWVHNYSKAKFFAKYSSFFAEIYAECAKEDYLSRINFKFIQSVCNLLDIKTKLSWSTDYHMPKCSKTERIIALCKATSATHYISGPLARNYIDENLFKDNDINLSYIDYSNYPVYPQLHGEFTHNVSILDLIFNVGDDAANYMKSF